MYQWVMSTLFVAVITVITTILTVKSTMRGYIVSPTAKGKLMSRGKKYGLIVVFAGLFIWALLWLIKTMSATGPITRYDVLSIAFWVSTCVLDLVMVLVAVILARLSD